ncbi:MAG: type II toxin-antitoxin system RelE/ParE family toxin [Prevotellaceae bacterium]|jgi:phage-related protein|nr:type II toxin-antitoxin system RelE/ParE family toxin [Prevotellaceae bacterium]
MKQERKILAYKNDFLDFISSLDEDVLSKIFYLLDVLKTQKSISVNIVKYILKGVYEFRVEDKGTIYRVFFCVDGRNIIILSTAKK